MSVVKTDSDQKAGQLLVAAYVKEIPSVGKERNSCHIMCMHLRNILPKNLIYLVAEIHACGLAVGYDMESLLTAPLKEAEMMMISLVN